MKLIYLLLPLFITFSCIQKHLPTKQIDSNVMSFSGEISNHLGKDGFVGRKGYQKTIKISAEGKFSDTLHLTKEGAVYTFSDGNEITKVFLKNGDNIHLTLDTKRFDESLKYTGNGAQNSNFLAARYMFEEQNLAAGLFDLKEKQFDEKLNKYKKDFIVFVDGYKNLAPQLKKQELADIEKFSKAIKKQYLDAQVKSKAMNALKGKQAPAFVNYENHKSGTTSLSDFKGKYVYIDVWATWCGPCKAEIPHLDELQKTFKGKNIEFVSISVDKPNAKEAWKKMVEEAGLGGTQLFADKDWSSEFVQDFHINSIPRFILIDDKGNIVDADAPRPSRKEKVMKLLEVVK